MADPPDLVPDLECRDLGKVYAGLTAVDRVSFAVPQGSFFSILGPSGCGKTTLLRMIAGFVAPSSGEIRIKGQGMAGVAPNRRPVNMVFQHLALFPMMNVYENVAFGLRRRNVPAAEIARRAHAVLERVGLPDMAARGVDQLSGGQKQRIAIARAMVLEPAVLLLDEPLGALDLKLREHMKIELKKLQSDFGTTFVYITHDQSEALVMSDQVAVMNQGVFEQVGTPRALYENPATAFVAGFVGEANRWRGRVDGVEAGAARVRLPDGTALVAEGEFALGEEVEVFVRPEAVRLARDPALLGDLPNRMTGQVESLLFNGAASRVLVRVRSGEVDVALPQSGEFADLARGEKLHLGWSRARCFPVGP